MEGGSPAKDMASTVITLDERQTTLLEQVLMDRDIEGAWQLLAEIRAQVTASNTRRCGIEKLREETPSRPLT